MARLLFNSFTALTRVFSHSSIEICTLRDWKERIITTHPPSLPIFSLAVMLFFGVCFEQRFRRRHKMRLRLASVEMWRWLRFMPVGSNSSQNRFWIKSKDSNIKGIYSRIASSLFVSLCVVHILRNLVLGASNRLSWHWMHERAACGGEPNSQWNLRVHVGRWIKKSESS